MADTNAVAKVSPRLIHTALVPEAAIAMGVDRECYGHQWDRVRVRLRRGAARDVSSRRAACAASESGVTGCREAGDGADRDHGCPGPWPVDRLGQERLRHPEQRIDAAVR